MIGFAESQKLAGYPAQSILKALHESKFDVCFEKVKIKRQY